MKKILVTAFEPFGGRSTNPSIVIQKSLPVSVYGCKVLKEVMPVSGKDAGEKIRALLQEHKPDIVLSFGLAAGETAVRIERFGLNIKDYGIKDNSGERPSGEKICVSGPAAYMVSIPPEKIVEALIKKHIPAYASSHAGTYVCNTLIYEAMRAIDELGLNTKYLFVHFPLSTEEAVSEKPVKFPPSLPEKMLKDAGNIILKHIAKEYLAKKPFSALP